MYRLGDSIALAKSELREKITSGQATDDEIRRHSYFRYGAFAFVLIYVCSRVLSLWLAPRDQRYLRRAALTDELIFNQPECEAFLAKFAGGMLGPIDNYLSNRDAYQTLKLQEGVQEIANHTKMIVEQVHHMNAETYRTIIEQLDLVG